jgi:LysM repeat protein
LIGRNGIERHEIMETEGVSRMKAKSGTWILPLALALLAPVTSTAKTHIVRKGESLSLIALKYRVSKESIIQANKLSNPNMLRAGKRLEIPGASDGATNYTVKTGDSLGVIAQRFGTTTKALSNYNKIADPSLIKIGQKIKIPPGGKAQGRGEERESTLLPSSIRKELGKINVNGTKWKGVVIHHSATEVGSAKALDNFHKNQRRMENGLAYHFVIGNGKGMGDGDIHIGNRWVKQLDGGHLKMEEWNKIYIGICLIGNFEKQTPSPKQMDALEGLVRHLMRRCSLDSSAVTTHKLQHKNHTLCPGKNFSISALKRRL